VLLVVAGVAAYLVGTSHSSTSTNLAPTAPVPAGVVPQTFAPDGLGATLMVPSTWANSPPSSGFQYVIRGTSPPAGFVGATRRGGVVPITVAQLESQRRSFLQGVGARIDSVTRGTVDSHPAVRFRYTISGNGVTVSDTEYDVIVTGTLAVGAAQHQTTYDVIAIVVGTPVSQPNPALVDWISSTVTIR
jgi:hypothetical protein